MERSIQTRFPLQVAAAERRRTPPARPSHRCHTIFSFHALVACRTLVLCLALAAPATAALGAAAGAASEGESAAEAGWEVKDGRLFSRLQILDLLPNGTLALSPGTRRVFLEVGANSVNTVAEDELRFFSDAHVISFEPLLHHYGALLARARGQNGIASPTLGEQHHRGTVIPFAVGPDSLGGFAELRIPGNWDACSSLLPVRRAEGRPEVCGNGDSNRIVRERRVPVVSLRTVLSSWLAWEQGEGWPVDYLKIDAQGLDLEVLRSAGDQLHRIQRVVLEVPQDTCEPLYVGAPHCSAILAAMADLGFSLAYNGSCSLDWGGCHGLGEYSEYDWEFVRDGVAPLHYGVLPWGAECWRGLDAIPGDGLGRSRRRWCCSAGPREAEHAGCWNDLHRRGPCCDLRRPPLKRRARARRQATT